MFGVSGVIIGRGTVIYPGAIIAATFLEIGDSFSSVPKGSITIGENCQVMYNAVIASYGGKVSIGSNVSVNPFTILYGHGGLTIGDFTRIATSTVVIPANHVFSDPYLQIAKQGLTERGIIIEDDVWIGAGVRILDGVRIGKGSVLAAGAVITKDVPELTVVGGVPGRPISKRGSVVKTES